MRLLRKARLRKDKFQKGRPCAAAGAGNAPLVGVITRRLRAEMEAPDDFARAVEGDFLFQVAVGVAFINVAASRLPSFLTMNKCRHAVLDAGEIRGR